MHKNITIYSGAHTVIKHSFPFINHNQLVSCPTHCYPLKVTGIPLIFIHTTCTNANMAITEGNGEKKVNKRNCTQTLLKCIWWTQHRRSKRQKGSRVVWHVADGVNAITSVNRIVVEIKKKRSDITVQV